jgi:hypothetical protein
MGIRGLLFGTGFFDKHDGDVILDWIDPVAFLAEKPRAIRGDSDRFLAGRAGENFQESGVQRHGHLLTHAPWPVNEMKP